MRAKKALINTISGLLYEFVTLICGLIIPRLILNTFGSSYNGITNSVSQFLSCIVLLRAGVAGVTKVALYKPLAEKDTYQVSKVIRASEKFLHKVGTIYAGLVLGVACIYPFIIKNEFTWSFSAALVIIIAISSLVENYIGFTYQILLNADQRYYVTFFSGSVSTIVNALLAYILIKAGYGIHAVKLGSAIAFSLSPLFYYIYAHRKYDFVKDVEPDKMVLSQRWDALAHQVAYFVNENTDIMILTIFSSLKEVSVYSVYHMVTKSVIKLLKSSTAGIGDAFGNMMAKNETKLVNENFKVFELIVFTLATILFTTTGLMIIPFINIYTQGITDVEYSRPLFATIIVLASFFNCARIPYQHLVETAGHFKQTRNGAIFEAFLNISISIIFVIRYGVVGVATGTLAATVFRTLQYSIYMSRNIVKRNLLKTIWHIITSFIICALTVLIYRLISPDILILNFLQWASEAVKVFVIVSILSIIKIFTLYRSSGVILISKAIAVIEK